MKSIGKAIKIAQTLVFLIYVLSWISVLGGIFQKSNKHPPLNKDPGRRISTIFSFLTLYFAWSFTIFLIFSYFLRFLSEICEKTIAILSLIRTSWDKKCWKIIRMSWTSIRNTRVYISTSVPVKIISYLLHIFILCEWPFLDQYS